MTTTIRIKDHFGSLCANGDKALSFLDKEIMQIVESGENIIFDFTDVRNMNSSFSNALFSNLIIRSGESTLSRIKFKNCKENIKSIINAALSYGLSKKKNMF